MKLRKSGLSILLIDKNTFPRDKVCGDAIGGRAVRVLSMLDPSFPEMLEKLEGVNKSAGWKLYAPNGKSVELHFTYPGHVARRQDFDNFLFRLVKDSGKIEIREGFQLKDVHAGGNFINITNDLGESYHSKLLIACDGAQSVVAKRLAKFRVDLSHYSGAVRAYYTNIKGIYDKEMIEIHLLKKYLPGYFWLFPLDENSANVGFGMLSSDIARRKINLKAAMEEIIYNSPALKDRFKESIRTSDISGFGLPLGGRDMEISGERFMLCGDAASLIDPLNGEGIGNAMLSGLLAGEQALKCFESDNFSVKMMKHYDDSVKHNLTAELKKKLTLQRLFNRSWLINGMVNAGLRFPLIKHFIGRHL